MVSCVIAAALAGVGPAPAEAQFILVPMDRTQTNHLKAYGLTYWTLEHVGRAEWLLNYRGGSFLLPDIEGVRREAALRGVSIQPIGGADGSEPPLHCRGRTRQVGVDQVRLLA